MNENDITFNINSTANTTPATPDNDAQQSADSAAEPSADAATTPANDTNATDSNADPLAEQYQNLRWTLANGCARGLSRRGVSRSIHKLNAYDWLADVPDNDKTTDLVEVQFKNTRKAYYHNVNGLELKKGDWVAVEAAPGHDVGIVTMTGRLVILQVKKANLRSADDIRRIYRLAKESDMECYREAKSREEATMIQSRQIAKDLGLQMKIGDVEYQGDGNKAIFYYIADERVDFRQLIKVLAETFHVRIEMKQIGARQEAGRIGGTGPCGRELCCATWIKNYTSVSTNAARLQDLSPNPQKLAGMCAKLKCCLNYELDNYMEAGRNMPHHDQVLQTQDNDYYVFKQDILAQLITYSTDKHIAANLVTISARRAQEVIAMNKEGKKPLTLQDDDTEPEPEKPIDLLDDTDLTRFDIGKRQKRRDKRKKETKPPRNTDPNADNAEQQSSNTEQKKGQDNHKKGDNTKKRKGDNKAKGK